MTGIFGIRKTSPFQQCNVPLLTLLSRTFFGAKLGLLSAFLIIAIVSDNGQEFRQEFYIGQLPLQGNNCKSLVRTK